MSLADQSQQWYPTSVQVTVLQARGLRGKGKNGTNDAYAVMQVAKEKYATSVAEKSVAPMWKEEASFDLPPAHHGNAERCTLHVHVMHRALVGPDKPLGQAVINLLQLSEETDRTKTQWFKLVDKAGKTDKDRGEVLLDVQFLRNNMTASMFDLSAADKPRSRLGKLKAKVRGKKKEGLSDAASAVVPSFTQVLTDSEEGEEGEEGEGRGHGGADQGADKEEKKKKKRKLKTLFSPKSNLQKTMSQSMSVLAPLPEKNSSLSSSRSSGLNVDPSEGKKKFKFLTHKRSGSSESRSSQGSLSVLGRSKHAPPPPVVENSNLCINGSHVYSEEPQPRTSRAGSNFSLASSGHGSMGSVEDLHSRKTSVTSADSLRPRKQHSPLAGEEEMSKEEEEEEEEGDQGKLEERKREEEEEEREREEEKERMRGEIEEEKRRRLQEEETARFEEEEGRIRREEEDRIRMEEQERARVEEERRAEEERKRRMQEEEEEMERLAEEKRRLGEEERRKEEELRSKREEEEMMERMRREEEERTERMREEDERLREEEKERLRREMEEKTMKEEQDRLKREEEEEQERSREEEERTERERVEEEKRLRKEIEEKRGMEEEQRIKREEEEEGRLREEEKEERRRKEEGERQKKAEEENRRMEEEERRIEEERVKKEEEEEEEEGRRREEAERQKRVEERKREEAERQKRVEDEERRKREEAERQKMVEGQERRKREEEEGRKREEAERQKRVEDEERRKREEEESRLAEEERLRREEEHRQQLEDERRAEEEQRARVEEERRKEEKSERGGQIDEDGRLSVGTAVSVAGVPFTDLPASSKPPDHEIISSTNQSDDDIVSSSNQSDDDTVSSTNPFEEEVPSSPTGARSRSARVSAVKPRTLSPPLSSSSVCSIPSQHVVPSNPFLEDPPDTDPLEKKRRAPPPPSTKHDPPGKPVSATPNLAPTKPSRLNTASRDLAATPPGGSREELSWKESVGPDGKEPAGSQRDKRPAPRPPGGLPDRQTQREQSVSTGGLGQADRQRQGILPQRLVQMIAPLSRAFPLKKEVQVTSGQSSAQCSSQPQPTPSATASSHNKGPAPSKPVVKQPPVVFGSNPFEDDETEKGEITSDPKNLSLDPQGRQSSTNACLPDPPAAGSKPPDEDDATKCKSSKVARAPPPPAKRTATAGDQISTNQSAINASPPDSSLTPCPTSSSHPAPLETSGTTGNLPAQPQAMISASDHMTPLPSEAQPVAAQCVGEEAGGKGAGPTSASHRSHPVKPRSSVEQQQSASLIQAVPENKPTAILSSRKERAVVREGPYSQLTQAELISLLAKQQKQLSERDKKIGELEQYIDNLLVRVIEEQPSILMSLGTLKRGL